MERNWVTLRQTGPGATDQTWFHVSLSEWWTLTPCSFLDTSKDNNQVTLLLEDTPWLPTAQGIQFHIGGLHAGPAFL